jgi:tRNA G18 (ribose-2'-O)-methylase SpoU
MSRSGEGDPPKIYLLIENRAKSNNLGSILRCASAFGVTTIVAIGFSKCAVKGAFLLLKYLDRFL